MIRLLESIPPHVLAAISISLLLANAQEAAAQAPPAPTLTLSTSIKQLELSWSTVSGATHYVVWESPDGIAPFSALSGRIPQPAPLTAPRTLRFTKAVAVHRHDWLNALYFVAACNAGGCSPSIQQGVAALELDAIGYLKPKSSGAGDGFGYSVALSADGRTLAVGAPHEDCSCTGIDPFSIDDLASEAGAVYVFAQNGGRWAQQAYIKARDAAAGDYFGTTLALSADGNTLVVGAPFKTVPSGLNHYTGHVYAYSRTGPTWQDTAILSASNRALGDQFGAAVALSADGSTLAIAATGEDSDERGVGGSGLNDDARDSGAVYIFSEAQMRWSQTAYIKGSNSDALDGFGGALALSNDGNTLAVGIELDDAYTTGAHAPGTSCALPNVPPDAVCEAGAVDVYYRTTGGWRHGSYLRAAMFDSDDQFGSSVALSGDGLRLAVGARGEDGALSGINQDASDNDAPESGAAYVFERSNNNWTQTTYLKPSDTDSGDWFGGAVAFDAQGRTLAVSARREDGSAAGVSGTADEFLENAGAVFLFDFDAAVNGQWSEARYVKAQNPGMYDHFGGTLLRGAVALSGDGRTLVVPAADEDGSGSGVPGTPQDDAALAAGAVYLY